MCKKIKKLQVNDDSIENCAMAEEEKEWTDEEIEKIAAEIYERAMTTPIKYESPALKALEKDDKLVIWRSTGLFY